MVDAISSSNSNYRVEVQKANEEANEAAYQAVDTAINMKFGSVGADTPKSLGQVEKDFAEYAKKIFDEKKEETFAEKLRSFFGGWNENKTGESKSEDKGVGAENKDQKMDQGVGKPVEETKESSKFFSDSKNLDGIKNEINDTKNAIKNSEDNNDKKALQEKLENLKSKEEELKLSFEIKKEYEAEQEQEELKCDTE